MKIIIDIGNQHPIVKETNAECPINCKFGGYEKCQLFGINIEISPRSSTALGNIYIRCKECIDSEFIE